MKVIQETRRVPKLDIYVLTTNPFIHHYNIFVISEVILSPTTRYMYIIKIE
jgi:hypothetical protein